jgi:twitching motility protein PilT
MTLNELLDELSERKGSDLHLVVGEPPIFRVNGHLLRREETTPLNGSAMDSLILPYLTEPQRARISEGYDVEKTLALEKFRYRFLIFHERGNLAASLRVVPNQVPTLEELGFTDEEYPLHKLTKLKRGLIIVAGPTGSGKSTTIAAMVEEINRTRAERIITIEDPIEYEFQSKLSVVSQRTVGEDVPNFPSGLRSAFRADPDVLLIGEARDLETMILALTLADTGHLVFMTLHVNTASEAVRRLIDVFPESHQPVIRRQVSNNLQAVIAQTLVPRHNQPGRVPAEEILIGTPRIRRMIAEGNYDLTIAIEAEREMGMRTKDDDLVRLANKGVISVEMARSRMDDRNRLPYPE